MQSLGTTEKDGEEGRMGRPGYIRTNLLSPLWRASLSLCKRKYVTGKRWQGSPRFFLHEITRFTFYFAGTGTVLGLGGLAYCTKAGLPGWLQGIPVRRYAVNSTTVAIAGGAVLKGPPGELARAVRGGPKGG